MVYVLPLQHIYKANVKRHFSSYGNYSPKLAKSKLFPFQSKEKKIRLIF